MEKQKTVDGQVLLDKVHDIGGLEWKGKKAPPA